MKRIGAIFNYRPFTVIGLITALHTLAYGVGYLIPTSGFGSTVLYASLTAIVDPFWIGILLLSLGLYSVWAWAREDLKHISTSSSILAFFWLFVAMTYFVAGAFGLGVGVGLVWSLLSGYIAFAYKQKEETAMHFVNQYYQDILDGKIED